MTNSWLVAAVCILPPLLAALIACGRQAVSQRLIAVQLATSLSVFMLIALSFAFNQASSIDLALTLAILTLPGTCVVALFVERWL